jgi:hypothetical protein
MVWQILAWIALASCSAEQGGNMAAPLPGGTEAKTPMTKVDPLFAEDFSTSYVSVLWTMMFLRLCDARWGRPTERAELEARLAAIKSKALGHGLKRAMEQAEQRKAQMMATMRIDTQCHGGFERAYQSAKGALTEIEDFLVRRTKEPPAAGGDTRGPPQEVRFYYLGVDAAFFSLKACREPDIVREVAAQRARFEDIEQRIAQRLGRAALTSLRDHASMQSAVKMVEQCAGDGGMQRLRENLDRLAALVS